MSQKLPVISIVGRQNVGKSTLFNALIGKKKSIVDAFPGLTRDIIAGTVVLDDAAFILADTPGLDIQKSSQLSQAIIDHALRHLERSAAIILLMENPSPSAFDLDLLQIVRKLAIPTIIAINKMDNDHDLENIINFYETGINEIIPVSALRRRNIGLLQHKIVGLLPSASKRINEVDLNIAIVGRPNSGKSTLLNSFCGYARSIVSDIPGTTRDAVDEDFMYTNTRIRVIDTAGIRKKSKIDDSIEFFSLNRTIKAIEESDVAIHLLDAMLGLTVNDKKIADEIIKMRKPSIIAINKWDTVPKNDKTLKEYTEKIKFQFYKAVDYPIISISARDKQRISKLLDMAIELKQRANRRIETAKLNALLTDLQKVHRPPQLGDRLKIFYATQVETIPPQFKIFVNNAELFKKDVQRFLEKYLQKALDLHGIPIILNVEGRKRSERGHRQH